MRVMKVLNLYAGIGGNRKLWEDVEVTAVELDPKIAAIYQDYFPDDNVIVGDAHQYLLHHYKEYDFIWASPPCPTHSRARFWGWQDKKPVYPDMKLYQEILLLKHTFNGLWCVENVKPYYTPMLNPANIGRHLFWSNFRIGSFVSNDNDIHQGTNKQMEESMSYDLSSYDDFNTDKYKGARAKLEVLRNAVNPELGLYILNCARNIITKQNEKQIDLFK
jgi:DNA (cytosine-5)-methyltransferase 1